MIFFDFLLVFFHLLDKLARTVLPGTRQSPASTRAGDPGLEQELCVT
ncbi:MAG: hypothetical protein KGM95_07025 [Betaproteobacteria bacterium]|nr:hypothetical protein [Betaproteobacteria bacterium]